MSNIDNLPISLTIGKLRSIDKSDAEIHCKTWIENHFENPTESFYFLKKEGEDFYYEIQELGNGKAFLPSIIEAIKNGESSIIVPSATRNVELTIRDNDFKSVKLRESDNRTASDFIKRSSTMIPYQNDSKNFLFVGGAFFAMGLIVFLSAYIIYINSEQVIIPEDLSYLNDSFYDRMTEIESLKEELPNTYIKKLTFENNKWQKQLGNLLIDNNIKNSDTNNNENEEVIDDNLINSELPLPPGIKKIKQEQ